MSLLLSVTMSPAKTHSQEALSTHGFEPRNACVGKLEVGPLEPEKAGTLVTDFVTGRYVGQFHDESVTTGVTTVTKQA